MIAIIPTCMLRRRNSHPGSSSTFFKEPFNEPDAQKSTKNRQKKLTEIPWELSPALIHKLSLVIKDLRSICESKRDEGVEGMEGEDRCG